MKSILWTEWSKAFSELRGAFSRSSTFVWAAIFCAGMATRTELRGISCIVSTLGLKSTAYYSLLRVCHSDALDLDRLRELWVKLCLKIFSPICIDGYMVLLGDGIKIAKEGKKMPAVKLMRQESQNNSKAEYIMGHFLQAISLVVISPLGKIAAIPIVARIHDGIVYSNRSQQTVINRFARLIDKIIADAELQAIVVEPIRRGVTKQYMYRQSDEYRRQVDRKLKAFHAHIAFGCIVQGLSLHLSLNFRCHVWASFNGWLRTFSRAQEPSELVVTGGA